MKNLSENKLGSDVRESQRSCIKECSISTNSGLQLTCADISTEEIIRNRYGQCDHRKTKLRRAQKRSLADTGVV